MQVVKTSSEFQRRMERFEARPAESRPLPYAFFLYDERASHAVVPRFIESERAWLQSLNGSARIFMWFILEEKNATALHGEEPGIFIAAPPEPVRNPSLLIAKAYGISPSDLPGIVFFAGYGQERPNDGVYWRLPLEIFDAPPRETERALAQVFDVVQRAGQASAGSAAQMLAHIHAEVERLDRVQRAQPVLAAARDGLDALVSRAALSRSSMRTAECRVHVVPRRAAQRRRRAPWPPRSPPVIDACSSRADLTAGAMPARGRSSWGCA